MDSIILGPDGGTIIKFEPVTAEQLPGPGQSGQALLYYLKGVGFRIKTFGTDGEPLVEANVSVILQEQETDPAPISGKGQLYTKSDGGATELFYIDGGGVVTQLTSGDGLYLKLDGSTPMEADLDLDGSKIVNLGAPSQPFDAATKSSSEDAAGAAKAEAEAYADSLNVTAYHKGDASLLPTTDAAQSLGSAAKRLASIKAVEFAVFSTLSAAHPAVRLGDASIELGPGTGTFDSRISRTAIGMISLDDGLGNPIQLNLLAGKIIGLADPTLPQDADTKAARDAAVSAEASARAAADTTLQTNIDAIPARYFFGVTGLVSGFDNDEIIGITGQGIPISVVQASLEVADDADVVFDVVLVNRTTGVVSSTLKTCTIPSGALLLDDSFSPATPASTHKVKILVTSTGTTGKSLGVLVK